MLAPWFVAGILLASSAGPPVIDHPCVPEPVFPPDCGERLGALGGPVLDRPDEGFQNAVSPVVDPLLLLDTAPGAAGGEEGRLYALNPSADRVRVFDMRTGLQTLRDIPVCRRPSALAQSESGDEVYVACHGSAAVAVIDTTVDRVVAVIQDRDDRGRPRLSEPMGMVTADDTLYVASSQNDRIAVVDLQARAVVRYLDLPGRDPRSLALAGAGRYLVAAHFMAGNRTEPRVEDHPAARDPTDPVGAVCAPLFADAETAALADASSARFMDASHPRYAEVAECYLFAQTFGSSSAIVRQPRRADHDLVVVERDSGRVVFTTDALDHDIGAVNYHLSVDPAGERLYLVSTQARNELGPAFGLRPIVNRLAILDLDPATGALSLARLIDLDGATSAPAPDGSGRARAPLPSAVARYDGGLLIAAAGADALIVTTGDGTPRSTIPVGFGPRGVVVRGSDAFVFNATALSVSRVDLTTGNEVAVAPVGPSPLSHSERHGARLFNSAAFSVDGSFACASCHPDGQQDGLVWELNDRDGLRATLPVAGIAETAPYHWDGSKCNLLDIVQDSVADLFRNPRQPDPCEAQALIDYIQGLARPGSPYRALDDGLSAEAALGSAVVHRGRFKDVDNNPRTCSQRFADPATETLLARTLGDPAGATFRFNGGGGPLPATRSSESCSLANCHVTPFAESDGFRNGDPQAGLVDGYQAVSIEGAWDRPTTQHDGRTTRHDFVRALAINRAFHGAGPITGAEGRGGLAAQAFNDANFRHTEYNFDDSPSTHGFELTDAMTRHMLEEQSAESAAVGLTFVVDRRPPRAADNRLLAALTDAATQGKLALLGVGTLEGRLTRLTFRAADGRLVADGGAAYTFDELRRVLAAGDALVFRGARLPGPVQSPPGLLAILRDTSPILCSEGYARYPATLETGERDARLIIRASAAPPGTRVLIDGTVRGAPLTGPGPEFVWSLPQAPQASLTPTILTLRLLSPVGLLSGGLPLPVVPPVSAAFEPADLAARSAPGLTEFGWRDQFGLTGPGTRYDVFRGDLAALRAGRAGDGECITPRDWDRPRITDGRDPAPGAGLFYLVRAQNQLGVSSWGNPARDAALGASARSCRVSFPDAVRFK